MPEQQPPPGPPPGPRDPADGWVELPDGRRFWGRAGAAGLLALTPDRRLLLQHRVGWSHFGGTWGLPGGARHLGESALEGALREAHEETAIGIGALRPRFSVRLDLQVWSYTTVVADADSALPVSVSDRESTALQWVAADEVTGRELHPGFAAAWPQLAAQTAAPRSVLVVDAANVVGSRPDGWWRDRAGASSRLLQRLAVLAASGIPAQDGEQQADPGVLPVDRRWPRVVVVLEGRAREAPDVDGLQVVRADGEGDDAVVQQVEAAASSGAAVEAVTADRALADRVRAAGGTISGPSGLLALLDPLGG